MAFDEGELQPMRSSTNVTYTYTDSGKVKNVLFATNLDQFQDGDSSYSKISNGFSLTFYTPEGEFDGKLTAQNGYIGNDNSIMIARDSVVFINQANEKLNTEELIWRQDSATVTTDKFVTIEQEDIVIYGKGLWSNQNFTNYVIKEVTGSFYLKENEDESGQ